MGAFDDADLTGRTGGRRTSRPRCAPLAAALLVFLTLFCLFAAVAPAGAVTAPGRPTAKTPKGAINTTRPTFKWSKAARAAKYEVRVYKGRTLKLKKTGITRLSWKSSKTLPRGVSLTWKVRGRNAGGNGTWSKRLTFKVRAATKAITAFSFQGLSPAATGSINESAHTIALTVPLGTNVSALVATFATTGASVAIAGTPQVSGTTADNFSNPVTYTVTAADASTQDYAVTVTVAANPAKAITAFSFSSPAVTGSINEAAHTIALTVPFGTNVSALSPSITITGASVSPASGAANNFTSPRTYTVTAADASDQDYTVTVTVALNPAKAITAFSFSSPAVTGSINEAARTIALTVPPYGTDVTVLVATFTTTGASVAVGATPQASGTTPNDFTNPFIYTVTAADGTTQAYVVTVTVAAPVIGQDYGGGKIAYILQSGDLGYSTLVTHGLIAAATDQSAGIAWSNIQSTSVGTTETLIGTGQANTSAIVGQAGCTSGAAYLCDHLLEGGYSDWYLPSLAELNELFVNRVAIGGFNTTTYPYYWSSSEFEYFVSTAWLQYFGDGTQSNGTKDNALRVRAVRAF